MGMSSGSGLARGPAWAWLKNLVVAAAKWDGRSWWLTLSLERNETNKENRYSLSQKSIYVII